MRASPALPLLAALPLGAAGPARAGSTGVADPPEPVGDPCGGWGPPPVARVRPPPPLPDSLPVPGPGLPPDPAAWAEETVVDLRDRLFLRTEFLNLDEDRVRVAAHCDGFALP